MHLKIFFSENLKRTTNVLVYCDESTGKEYDICQIRCGVLPQYVFLVSVCNIHQCTLFQKNSNFLNFLDSPNKWLTSSAFCYFSITPLQSHGSILVCYWMFFSLKHYWAVLDNIISTISTDFSSSTPVIFKWCSILISVCLTELNSTGQRVRGRLLNTIFK